MTTQAERHLNGFLAALDVRGFTVPVSRRMDFFRALTLVDLASVDDLYWVARVTLVSSVTEIEPFDQVFNAWFRGWPGGRPEKPRNPDETADASRPAGVTEQMLTAPTPGEGTGRDASRDELLHRRVLPPTEDRQRDLCARIARAAAVHLPRTEARRRVRARRQGTFDIRRIVAEATRTGGEIVTLAYRRRPERLRRVLVLIDVSGSLKATSPDALRFAHALVAAAGRIEVFTFGTRLTRVTDALRSADIDTALDELAEAVFDLDGGTRIGPSFAAFLDNSRFLTLARGALVIVLSDGLERGEVETMAYATDRLARLAHRLVWLTPLVHDPRYRPVTRGMQAILGSLDRLGDASSLRTLLGEVTRLPDVETGPRRSVAVRWAAPLQPPSLRSWSAPSGQAPGQAPGQA